MAKFGYEGPKEYEPLSAWQYFWLSVLFSIPILGVVYLIIYSISKANYNRRSFARSYWCAYIVAAIVCVILIVTGASTALLSTAA